MVMKETIPTEELTLVKSTVASEFYCISCERDKKAKLKALWHKLNGMTEVICNACYGTMLARNRR